jgi:hypothetical protein
MGQMRTSLSGSTWISSWLQKTKPPYAPDSLLSSWIYYQKSGSLLHGLIQSLHEIDYLMLLKESTDMIRMIRTLLKVQVLSYFEYHLRRRVEAEDSDLPDNYLIELVIRELNIGLEYIPKREIFVQKYCMRQSGG